MPRYISLMSDFGFKHVFANPDHPHILINFIESILPNLSIKSITHISTTEMNEHPNDRSSIFDVYCVLDDGSQIIVEMQQVRQQYYVDRTVLYASHAIRRQSVKGPWDYNLPPIYVISIMNFRLQPNSREPVLTVNFRTDQHPEEIFYDKLQLIYIQIPNVDAILDDTHPLKNWIHCIRTLHTSEQPLSIDTTPTTTKAITDAMTLAEFEALSPQQKFFYDCAQHAEAEAYSKEMTMKMDAEAAGRAEGLAAGRAEGLAEGLEQGQYQEKIQTTRNLIQMGLTDEQIVQATGLSLEQIQSLR
jgi:predicted transposase/invertase (TIGR01784 family)